jgi:hypothetical protein
MPMHRKIKRAVFPTSSQHRNDLLSDQIAYKILDEEADLSILKVAEEKVIYLKAVHNGK